LSKPTNLLPEKPRSPYQFYQITRLPELTTRRRKIRLLLRALAQLVLSITCRVKITGLENFPAQGPALIVFNHLGDADVVVGLASLPSDQIQTLAKIDLFIEYPLLGWLMETYGVIWIHSGTPDRRALRAALQALQKGQFVAIAPEGRQSLSGALEEGMGGAAYLAIKTGTGILPVGVTGTENSYIYDKIRHFRKAEITLQVGNLFQLEEKELNHEAIDIGTQKIMRKIAEQIPIEYRGAYK
jgi:1-acyl-sn-glycerol-3-phosphate acyltransferase